MVTFIRYRSSWLDATKRRSKTFNLGARVHLMVPSRTFVADFFEKVLLEPPEPPELQPPPPQTPSTWR